MPAEVHSTGPRWSLRQIADRDGVTVKAISKAVARLVEKHDLPVSRDTRGRVSAVDLAAYDHLRGKADNASRVQAAATVAGRESRGEGGSDYNAALTEKTRYEATKRRLEVEELKGELVRTTRVADAATQVAAELTRVIDQLPSAADQLAAALARDGTRGLQIALKAIAVEWRNRLADQMAQLAAGAPVEDTDEQAEPEPAP